MKLKSLIILAVLAFSTELTAQYNFYTAELTKNDGSRESVFFRNKTVLLTGPDEIVIYSSDDNNSKMVLSAGGFKTIATPSNEIYLQTAVVDGLGSKQPVILRKLLDGKKSLYELIDQEGINRFVHEDNGTFILLDRVRNSNSPKPAYREWLYKNYNTSNLSLEEFKKLNYNSTKLVEYYKLQDNSSTLLSQEPKVKFFNLWVNAGFTSSTVTPEAQFLSYDDVSSTGYKVGILGSVNLGRISNKLTLNAGLNYYSGIEGSARAVLFPGSSVQQIEGTHSVSLSYLTVELSLQYNIHFSKFSVAPYLKFEPVSFIGNKDYSLILDDGTIYYDSNLTDNRATSFGLGFKVSYNRFYAGVDYSLLNQVETTFAGPIENGTIESSASILSLNVGFSIF
ncbi:MAG: hypothetical protein WBA16_05665 [Nonlabens sp.]